MSPATLSSGRGGPPGSCALGPIAPDPQGPQSRGASERAQLGFDRDRGTDPQDCGSYAFHLCWLIAGACQGAALDSLHCLWKDKKTRATGCGAMLTATCDPLVQSP